MAPIKVFTAPTPNAHKIVAALEELGLEYEVQPVAIFQGEQFSDEYKKVNPTGRIPAIIDEDGPGGEPITVCETGAILLYLVQKTGKLLPTDPRKRCEALQWLFAVVTGIAISVREFAHYTMFAAEMCADPYPTQRYVGETERVLAVLEEHLKDGKEYIAGGEFSIVDIAMYVWVAAMIQRRGKIQSSKTGEEYVNITAWAQKLARNHPSFDKAVAACEPPPP
ncbi:hypothetical protein CBR_g49983 [Chara braunii]|uniref:Glutathione S-transferase n=1 Tax=Chara braunii TaxID=69332 RepID=A0A388K572_CHABU|nr:hypothetical protein CBR_g49983 [Chara braunii]|eukprot:GBG65191.1 hypothetical protein CBR_g49983 [Chara braunii]